MSTPGQAKAFEVLALALLFGVGLPVGAAAVIAAAIGGIGAGAAVGALTGLLMGTILRAGWIAWCAAFAGALGGLAAGGVMLLVGNGILGFLLGTPVGLFVGVAGFGAAWYLIGKRKM